MARLIGIEWDSSEARVVVAKNRGSDISVESAFAIPLNNVETGQTGDLAEQLKQEFESRNLVKNEAIVAVSRASVEIRQLQLPPVPPEEVPDMVRLQAMRQFTTVGDDWPLDFCEVAGAAEGDAKDVLAAAISPKLIESIKSACEESQLTLDNIALRSFAGTSLLRRRNEATDDDCRIVVDFLSEEADLTILVDGRVALMRTVRLPQVSDPEAIAKALQGEMRRTIAAAQSQLGGRRVESATICGAGSEHSALERIVRDQLSLNVNVFDPFDQVHVSGELRGALPDNHGRYSPLIGMLADQLLGEKHEIDFLNPRQRPKEPSKVRKNSMYGLVTISVIAAVVILVAGIVLRRNAEINELKLEHANLTKVVKDGEPAIARRDLVNAFLKTDVNWLDEIYRLSGSYETSDDIQIESVTMDWTNRSSAGTVEKGGRITVNVRMQDNNLGMRMKRNLQAKGYRVETSGLAERPRKGSDHDWVQTQKIFVERNRLDQMIALRNEKAAEANAAANAKAEGDSKKSDEGKSETESTKDAAKDAASKDGETPKAKEADEANADTNEDDSKDAPKEDDPDSDKKKGPVKKSEIIQAAPAKRNSAS